MKNLLSNLVTKQEKYVVLKSATIVKGNGLSEHFFPKVQKTTIYYIVGILPIYLKREIETFNYHLQ